MAKKKIDPTNKKQLEEAFINHQIEQGIVCPECRKGVIEYKDNGLVEIVYNYRRRTRIGIRYTYSGTASQEYQVHYKKCPECGKMEIIEYRETPSWFDDLCRIDCPFTKGNVIEDWKSGKLKKHPNDEFVEYKIIR